MPAPQSCLVTGKFLSAVIDSADDPDREPEIVPIAGAKVTLTASVARVRASSAEPPATIFMRPIECMTDETGQLIGPDGIVGVRIIATDDATLNPTGWTWTAVVSAAGLGTISATFSAPGGGTVDLTTAIPVPSSPGTEMQAWTAAVATTTAARDEAVAAAEAAEAAAADALEAGGGGIAEVSGTITLPADGPRVVQMYTIGAATINGEAFAVDTALVARRTAVGVWQVAVVADDSWRPFGTELEPDVTPPTAPTIDSATPGHSSIIVTFSGGTDDTYVTRYRVRVTGGPWSPDQPVGTPSYTITGLTPSTAYTVEVQAGDAAGNWSVSATQAITTAAAPLEFNTLVFYDSFDRTPVGPNYSSIDPGNNVADSLHEWTGDAGVLNGTRFVGNVSGAVTFTVRSGTSIGPYINHGVPAATTMQLTAQVTLVANTAGRVRITPRNESATTLSGFWLMVSREATRDIVLIGTSSGFDGTIDYNINNGTANWAHIPGADYAVTRTLDLRAILTASKITVWIDDVKLLEGTRTVPLTAAPFLEAAQSGVQVHSIRLETP